MIQLNQRPIRVMRIIARMNIGGPAVQVAGLMRRFDSVKFNQQLYTGYCGADEADYLEMVARGEVPRWDTASSKWVSNLTTEETIGAPKSSTPVVDPQDDAEVDGDLPF